MHEERAKARTRHSFSLLIHALCPSLPPMLRPSHHCPLVELVSVLTNCARLTATHCGDMRTNVRLTFINVNVMQSEGIFITTTTTTTTITE
ncbi:hypothetical protein E2C01_012775 [Portunus trituberculatus]|uniref:Uncharacterized protein n=1 Tax=Portunus trituberculatus TaxID=210409 RepID=A0A5B7DF09_PORTR|nr:hypothetical protein [Portunus trituberculatus]